MSSDEREEAREEALEFLVRTSGRKLVRVCDLIAVLTLDLNEDDMIGTETHGETHNLTVYSRDFAYRGYIELPRIKPGDAVFEASIKVELHLEVTS